MSQDNPTPCCEPGCCDETTNEQEQNHAESDKVRN